MLEMGLNCIRRILYFSTNVWSVLMNWMYYTDMVLIERIFAFIFWKSNLSMRMNTAVVFLFVCQKNMKPAAKIGYYLSKFVVS